MKNQCVLAVVGQMSVFFGEKNKWKLLDLLSDQELNQFAATELEVQEELDVPAE
jgi:hypothetical protein